MPRDRSRRRDRAATAGLLAAGLLTITPTLATAASPSPGASTSQSASPSPSPLAPPDPHAIGGPRMGEHGVIVEKAAGVPALPALTAKSYIVVDLDTGAVLAAKDPHLRNRPASTLKTLTALTLIPTLDPKARAPFTAADLQNTVQADGKSTRIGLEVGRAYPINRLFEAMLATSANDAAEALAGAAPGGRDATLAAMNAEAQHLQAFDTHAGTPSGLDATGQYTSTYDLALIARAALALPAFDTYNGAKRVMLIGSHGLFGDSNHNRLLNSYAGAYAGKDGYTTLSGQVWWGAAQRNGHHLLVSLLGDVYAPVTEEISLLNWGFAALPKAVPVGALVSPAVPGQPAPTASLPAGVPTAGLVPPAVRAKEALEASAGGGSSTWEIVVGALVLLVLALVLIGRRRRAVAGRSTGVPRARPLPSAAGTGLGRAGRTAPAMAPPPSLATGAVKIVPRADPAPDTG